MSFLAPQGQANVSQPNYGAGGLQYSALVAGIPIGTSGSGGGGGGGVNQLIAGSNVTLNPTNGLGNVTINATGGGGGGGVTSLSTTGSGIGLSASTGAVNVTNTGVSSIVGGQGITPSTSTGVVTLTSNPLTMPVGGLQGTQGKGFTIPTGLTTLMNYTGGPGFISRIWIAGVSGNSDQLYVRGTFDGILTIGTAYTSGTINYGAAVNVNQLMSNMVSDAPSSGNPNARNWASLTDNVVPTQGGSNAIGGSTYTSKHLGSSFSGNDSQQEVIGYIRMDMPYQSSANISLYNAGESMSVYFNIENCQTSIPASITSHLYIQPFQYTGMTSSQSGGTGTWQEVALMSFSSVNGVIFYGVKTCLTTPRNDTGTGNMFEGRFRIYSGGAGMTVGAAPTTYTYSTSTSTGFGPSTELINYYGNQAGVTTLYQSTGTEDFPLNGQDWEAMQLHNSDEIGTISDVAVDTNDWKVAFYRFWDTVAYSSPSRLTVTYSPGTPGTGIGSGNSGSISGVVFFYA